MKDIRGSRGNWFAEWKGERLPVLHSSWRVGSSFYRDSMQGVKRDGKRYRELIAALSSGNRAIVQRDAPGSLDRAGYVGVFTYEGFEVEEDGGFHLTFTGRIG